MDPVGVAGAPSTEAQARTAWAARASYGRLLALLASASGDIEAAEDALADALARALATWPRDGVPAPTLAARLVRAKRRIKAARIPFRIDRSALPARMAAVLEAVYGAHAIARGIAGTQQRPRLGSQALHLAETLAELAPADAEARGLAALICLSLARASARLDAAGRFVPLAEQDPDRWDAGLLRRGREHLRAAHALGQVGRYQLEAAIQALHCARREQGTTDWAALRDLHASLDRLAPTLGSTTALAAVTAETDGPAAGLAILDRLGPAAQRFQPAWATRAHLLERLAGAAVGALIDAATSRATRSSSAARSARCWAAWRRRSSRSGGAEGNRTPGLLDATEALYQLSYSPLRAATAAGRAW